VDVFARLYSQEWFKAQMEDLSTRYNFLFKDYVDKEKVNELSKKDSGGDNFINEMTNLELILENQRLLLDANKRVVKALKEIESDEIYNLDENQDNLDINENNDPNTNDDAKINNENENE